MSTIEWLNPKNDLTKYNRDQLIASLVEKLSGRVLEAYLFGSFATITHGPESDIDIVLITETNLKFTERPIHFSDLMDIYPKMDILVYTPDEFARMQSDAGGFIQSAGLVKII